MRDAKHLWIHPTSSKVYNRKPRCNGYASELTGSQPFLPNYTAVAKQSSATRITRAISAGNVYAAHDKAN